MLTNQQIINQLKNRINSLKKIQLNDYYDQLQKKIPLEELIFKIITSSKFRKWAINQEVKDKIKEAIKLNIEKNEPIKISFTFGGYKLWRIPSYPLADWAEFFALLFYYDWLKLITIFYKPGIIFNFYSDDVIVNQINNVPNSDIKKYISSFEELLDFINSKIMRNFKFKLIRIKNIYSSLEFNQELLKNLNQIKELKLQPTNNELKATQLNYKFNNQNLVDQKKRFLLLQSFELHAAYRNLSKRKQICKTTDQIIVYADHFPTAIGLGTTKDSITKFWIGTGIIQANQKNIQYTIYSPVTYKEKVNFITEIKTNLINLKNPNFSKLLILRKEK